MWDRHEHEHDRKHFASITDKAFWGWPEVIVIVCIGVFLAMVSLTPDHGGIRNACPVHENVMRK